MKVTNIYLLLGICICFFCQSCGSEDEPSMDDIVGTWKLTEVSTDNGKTFSTWTLEKTTATFNENGTYSGNGYFGNGYGKWKKSGNTVTTYVDGSEYLRYTIKELTSSTCTLIMSQKGSDATIWIRCIKTSGNGLKTISKSELENITSFACNTGDNTIYLKFRNGHIYTKQVYNDGSAYNQNDITYTINGSHMTMELGWQETSGTIHKVTYGDGKIGIVMDFEGSYGIATWLSKTFKQSNYNF